MCGTHTDQGSIASASTFPVCAYQTFTGPDLHRPGLNRPAVLDAAGRDPTAQDSADDSGDPKHNLSVVP